jgi:hypothetical protein
MLAEASVLIPLGNDEMLLVGDLLADAQISEF